MKADAEGEAERVGVVVAGFGGDTDTGRQAEGSQVGRCGLADGPEAIAKRTHQTNTPRTPG